MEKILRNISSLREQLIISQALVTAIPVLEAEEHPHHSNIADMKLLIKEKYPLWEVVESAHEEIHMNLCKDEEECGTTE